MSLRRGVLLTLWLGALVIGSGSAQAGGMFLGTHGARPTARGGAFVAGADDLNAIYYNPAGVVLSHPDSDGWSILFDAGLVLQHVAYTRNDAGIERRQHIGAEHAAGVQRRWCPGRCAAYHSAACLCANLAQALWCNVNRNRTVDSLFWPDSISRSVVRHRG